MIIRFFDKMFGLMMKCLCFLCIVMCCLMLGSNEIKNISHPFLTAVIVFVVSFFIFRKISPFAGMVVCLIAYMFFTMRGEDVGTIVANVEEVAPYIIGLGLFLFFINSLGKDNSEPSSPSRSQNSSEARGRSSSEIEAERQREKRKAWGSPVGSGSCPYLLRIDMGYYEGWNCYRCGRTGATFDDGFCRGLCYYEWKYKNCPSKN